MLACYLIVTLKKKQNPMDKKKNSKVFGYSVCDTFNKLNSENRKRKFKLEINNGDDDHLIDVPKSVRDTIKKTSAIRKSRL